MKRKYKRIVVKIGSSSITNSDGIITKNLARIVSDAADLMTSDIEVVLVSSGAIQLARSQVRLKSGDITDLQALSAIGQPRLMNAYQKVFSKKGIETAQVLLTHQDLGAKVRSLNTINTINNLLKNKFIPIVNENDTISYSEITVGDNDQLAAMVGSAMDADLLIILTEPDGVYTGDPKLASSEKIRRVKPGDQLKHIVTKGKSDSGRGGMTSKIAAVRRVTPGGIPAIIATINKKEPIISALNGGGTFFEPEKSKRSERQEWLIAAAKAGASITIDKGAERALTRGSSLLPSGIVGCRGIFKRGDSIAIKIGRKTIGYGIAEYNTRETLTIKGLSTIEMKKKLPNSHSKVVIHRNNLTMVN